MKLKRNAVLAVLGRSKWKSLMICGSALFSFAIGSFTTAKLIHVQQVKASNDRVFELNVYHAVPGKVPKLENRFRDASKLIAQHKLDVMAYWVPNSDPLFADTFIYIVAAPSREEMEKELGCLACRPKLSTISSRREGREAH